MNNEIEIKRLDERTDIYHTKMKKEEYISTMTNEVKLFAEKHFSFILDNLPKAVTKKLLLSDEVNRIHMDYNIYNCTFTIEDYKTAIKYIWKVNYPYDKKDIKKSNLW